MCVRYSERVFENLVIQHEKRMRRVMLTFLASLAVRCFATLCSKRHNLREKKWFDFLYKFCLRCFVMLRRIQRYIIISVRRSLYNAPVYLIRF